MLSDSDLKILDDLLSYIVENAENFVINYNLHVEQLLNICGGDTRPYLPYLAKKGYIKLRTKDDLLVTLEGREFYSNGGFVKRKKSILPEGKNDEANFKLAAVMFTDIQGYSAKMSENREIAKKWNSLHSKYVNEKVADNMGKVVNVYGDGSLSYFYSVSGATKCGIEIQKQFIAAGLPVRIGIDMGEVQIETDGIFGNSVNTAARVESLSIPGAVLITRAVYNEIKNNPLFPARYIESYLLKGIENALGIYAIAVNGLKIPSKQDLSSDKAQVSKTVDEETIGLFIKEGIRLITSLNTHDRKEVELDKLLLEVINLGYPNIAIQYLDNIISIDRKENLKAEMFKFYFQNELWDKAEEVANIMNNSNSREAKIRSIYNAKKDAMLKKRL